MLIHTTTYHLDLSKAHNFIIWLNECYFPAVEETGMLKNPRIFRVLSHKEEGSECFTVQFEVEDSATLHHWLVKQGNALYQEMQKVFENDVVGFSTLLEVIK